MHSLPDRRPEPISLSNPSGAGVGARGCFVDTTNDRDIASVTVRRIPRSLTRLRVS